MLTTQPPGIYLEHNTEVTSDSNLNILSQIQLLDNLFGLQKKIEF